MICGNEYLRSGFMLDPAPSSEERVDGFQPTNFPYCGPIMPLQPEVETVTPVTKRYDRRHPGHDRRHCADGGKAGYSGAWSKLRNLPLRTGSAQSGPAPNGMSPA
jgi:hypothetical protein